MSSSDKNLERWLAHELRNVPLPEGLAARLKGIASGPDCQFDAALCEVPLPDGLLHRLKTVARSQPLDEALREVSLPAELLGRLHEIAAYTDNEIDAGLCDVPVPPQLRRSLRGIVQWRRPAAGGHLTRRVWHWAVAASLLLAVGLSYFGSMAGVVMMAYQLGPLAEPLPQIDSSIQLEGGPPDEDALAWVWQDRFSAGERGDAAGLPVIPSPFGGFAPPPPRPGPVAQLNALFSQFSMAPFDPWDEPVAEKEGLGLYVTKVDDALPELETVDLEGPRGIAPPLSKAYDRLHLIVEGVHPFVSPAADAALETIAVPLVTSRESYENTWQELGRGRLPSAEEVRLEEYLASIDYEFPRPKNRAVDIRTAAGPSPFGEEGLSLVQIGVQAAERTRQARRPLHLTVALDVSASMGRENRLYRIRRGLVELGQQLGPQDRLTIVTFSEEAELRIEDAGRDDLPELARVVEEIQPRNFTNFAAGVQMAVHEAVYAAIEPATERRIVLVTDGLGDLPPDGVERLLTLARTAADGGASLNVIDVGTEQGADSRLDVLARNGNGALRRAGGAAEIGDALAEVLAGESPLAARDATLTVKFNPKAVARYRLLGHESDFAGGLVTSSIEAHLRAGETATALFELELEPTAEKVVAEATLQWRDPAGGESYRVTRQISRLQFATSLLESPISLQRAALAAEVAEILRRSPYAPSHSSGLRRVAELAQRLPARTQADPTFAELLSLAELAQRAQAGRLSPRSGRAP